MSDVVACPRCSRNNSLRRTACLYCGEALPVTDLTAAVQVPVLRPVEDWERGFSVVLAPPDGEADPRQAERLREIARLEEAQLEALLGARVSLPVARVPTPEEAGLVARLLEEAGFRTSIVADADLALDRVPRRVRELEISGDTLRLHVLWGDWEELARADVTCVVEGRMVSSRVDILESSGQRKRELVETSEFFSESYAVDIYGPSLDAGYRIKADSFDFASLGGRPAPFVEANLKRLGAALTSFVGSGRYDASFRHASRLLDQVWPPASRVSSRGRSRRGDLRKYTASTVETDPLSQFTRYSRMRYVLARR
jgi:hypothetical protein